MALLDRFKSQPGWKSPDPVQRASAVSTLEDQAVLAQLAADDPDAQVRRAAVGRIADLVVLRHLAAQDADERVRGEARTQILRLALGARDASSGASAVEALEAERDLAAVAKQAPARPVAELALARLTDEHLLSTVARHAIHEALRVAALERVQAPGELADVAMKTEHRDIGLAAIARIQDSALLEQVAARARNRAVARRARSLLQAQTPGEAGELSAEARQQLSGICATVEALVRATDPVEASRRLAQYEQRWAEADEPDEELAVRFAAARRAAQEAIAGLDAAREESQRTEREVADGVAARRRLCDEVELLPGDADPEGLAALVRQFEALAPIPDADGEALTARFEAAVRAFDHRRRERRSEEERQARLAELAKEATELVAATDLVEVQRRWPVLEQEWQRFAAAGPSREVREAWEAAATRLREREADARRERARRETENLARWERTCARLEALAGGEPSLKEAERALRDSRPSIDQLGVFPSKADRDRLASRLEAVHAALLPKVQELRDLEEWRRWANAGVQEQLCARVESLREATDLADAARQLRDVRKQWSTVSTVPNSVSQALWNRFKTAFDEVKSRCDAHFAQESVAREEHVKARVELCERAEALAESTDWIRTAEELQQLQARWKTLGPVPRAQAQELFARFRAACDTFFTRRKADLAERKEVWAANQAKKEALCEKAEQLAESTEWAHAASALKGLQAEWRTIGPVRKNKSEQLWKRFRAASDTFFERYKDRDQLEMAGRVAYREGLCAEMERLADSLDAGDADTAAIRARVQTLWTSWRQSPPIPRERVEPLQARFEEALGRIVTGRTELFKRTDLDFEANRRRREELCAQLEALASGRRSAADLGTAPAATLATLLREALAANTIGGRVDAEAQRRAAKQAVRELQDAWKRVGPVPGEVGRQLAARFHATARRFGPADPAPRREGRDERRASPPDRGGRKKPSPPPPSP